MFKEYGEHYRRQHNFGRAQAVGRITSTLQRFTSDEIKLQIFPSFLVI